MQALHKDQILGIAFYNVTELCLFIEGAAKLLEEQQAGVATFPMAYVVKDPGVTNETLQGYMQDLRAVIAAGAERQPPEGDRPHLN